MQPTDELIAQLHQEEISGAKDLTFGQRFLAGAELFDYACSIARDSIKLQHPDWTDDQVSDEIRRRMDIADRMREAE